MEFFGVAKDPYNAGILDFQTTVICSQKLMVDPEKISNWIVTLQS